MKGDKNLKIGERLKKLRDRKHLTLQGLSDLFTKNGFDISDSTISSNENKNDIKSYVLNAYVRTFKVSSDYILGYTDTETRNIKTQAICDTLGLSEKAVSILKNDKLHMTDTINIILDLASKGFNKNPSACRLLTDIYMYLNYPYTDKGFVDISSPDKALDYVGLKMNKEILGINADNMDALLLSMIQKDLIELQHEYVKKK